MTDYESGWWRNSSPLSPIRNLASNFLQLVEWRGKSLDRSRSVYIGKESVRGCCSDGGGVLRSVNRPVGAGYPGPVDGGDRMAVLRRRQRGHPILARQSNQRHQRPQSSGRVAFFDTELRTEAASRVAGQSPDRRRRDVHDGGNEPRRGGSRCGHPAGASRTAPTTRHRGYRG